MNTSNNVQITVTKVIGAPGRGILAFGYIDDRAVRVGDMVQEHNHNRGLLLARGKSR